jgi:hypothetical protein
MSKRDLSDLVRGVHAAAAALAAARLRLAEASGRGTPVTCVDPPWEWARRMLASRAPKLRAFAGVVGYGLGCRATNNVPTEEPCIAVYVRRKLAPAVLRAQGLRALPRFFGTGARRIAVDVVELGDLARDGKGAHVKTTGDLLWRPAVFPGDCHLAVRLFGAASGHQEGVIENVAVSLPDWEMGTAILARIHAAPGDLGAALLDPHGLALGYLLGRATGAGRETRVFLPAALRRP